MSGQKKFNIEATGMIATEWDGVTDRNGDGQLTYEGDSVKSYEITNRKIVYYDSNGNPSVTIDSDGTTIH